MRQKRKNNKEKNRLIFLKTIDFKGKQLDGN